MDRRSFLLGTAPALVAVPTAALCGVPTSPATPAIHTPVIPSAQERIQNAMVEIRTALTELYPSYHFSEQISLWRDKGLVVLGANPLDRYEVKGFFCDDPQGWSPVAPYPSSDEGDTYLPFGVSPN